MPTKLTQPQLDLLLHAGVFGLCRIPAASVEDVNLLRDAGLVALDDDQCFSLTSHGEHHVSTLGGRLTAPHLH